MNDYPEFAIIDGQKYKINTDFRVAIECERIANDTTIGGYERALAIIYKLFGDKGLEDKENHKRLLKLGLKFLSFGKKIDVDNEDKDKEPDMDFNEDKGYIISSFKYDYQYNPYAMKYLHWYEFYNDLCNLSDSEFGTCCILNRVRNLRNYDTSQIKDLKEREKMEKAKNRVALKSNKIKKYNKLSQEQKDNMESFYNEIEK